MCMNWNERVSLTLATKMAAEKIHISPPPERPSPAPQPAPPVRTRPIQL